MQEFRTKYWAKCTEIENDLDCGQKDFDWFCKVAWN